MGFKKFTRGVRRLGRRTTDFSRFKSDVGSIATEARQFFSNKGVKRVILVAAMIFGGWWLSGKGSLAVAGEAGGGGFGTAAGGGLAAGTAEAAGTGLIAGEAGAGAGGGFSSTLGTQAPTAASTFSNVAPAIEAGGAGAGTLSSVGGSAGTVGATTTTSTGLTSPQATLAGYGVSALGAAFSAAENAKNLRRAREDRKVTFAKTKGGRLEISHRKQTKKERGLIPENVITATKAPVSKVTSERRERQFSEI